MARPARSPDDNSSEVQRFVELVRSTVPPLHPAGLPFIAGGIGLALAGRNRRWLRTTGLGAAGFSALFFRHPPRVPPSRPGVVLAPADGRVTLLDTAVPPAELGMGTAPMARISIFLSVFDAHVQRAPVAGQVLGVVHKPGQFQSADKDTASEANERNSMWLRTADGVDIAVVQIAGLVARRIVCTARTGDKLELGETYGLIRFGSRLDTYFPAGSRVLVEPGQRAVGGETILAELA